MKSGIQKFCFSIFSLLTIVALFVGCSRESSSNQATEPTAQTAANEASSNSSNTATEHAPEALKGNPDEKYFMVTFLSGIEYWKGAYRGFENAADLFGVNTEYTGAAQYDVNEQVTVLEQVIAQKPSGIAITAMNPDALAGPINKAIEAGIPVVTFDADAPKSKRYSFLATSNYNAGVVAARTLAKQMNEKGKVGVVTSPGQLNLEERTAGFKETIEKEFAGMEVISIQDGKLDQVEAARVTAGVLQANADIGGFFATDANSGVGVGTAVKEAGKKGDIKIISFDTDKGTLDMIKDGTISATLAQGTWNMGYWSMNYLYNLKHDLLQPVSDWKKANVSPLPPIVDTGVSVVTKENVDSYYQ